LQINPYFTSNVHVPLWFQQHTYLCWDVHYEFRKKKKTMFISSLPPVLCRRALSYLHYLCLFAYSGFQHILSCVFHPLCTLFYQFLWIVHFWPSVIYNVLLWLVLEIDSNGRFRRTIYNKRGDFNISIENFPFICSYIPSTPACGIYTSQFLSWFP
jgi:hypothetical protein